MSPTQPPPPSSTAPPPWNVFHTLHDVDAKVVSLLANADPNHKIDMAKCIELKLQQCLLALKDCEKFLKQKPGGGGLGPDCEDGFHAEGNDCKRNPPP